MTYDEFRKKMETWWAETDAREVTRKNSQGALLELMTVYQNLDAGDRSFADRVLSDWLASANDRKRFDALAMVDHFRIRSASGALSALLAQIEARADHEAPYELAKVRRILDRLAERGG